MTFNMAFALAGKTKQDNYYRIQDANSSICSVVTTGQIGQVMDSRDNEVYYIGKLKDNNCWMLDNLRLDITDSTALNSLTTTNTHVDADSLTSLKSGNRSAGNQYANGAIVQWDSNNPTNYNRAQANADSKDNTTTSFGNGSGKIGVYYNYCAASAGSYCYDEGSGVDIADTIQDAPYDLCPANWRMPTGGSLSGEYQSLYKAYSSDVTSFRNALSTPFSGYFYSGSVYDPSVGTGGDFWSSTYSNSSRMFYMFVDSNNVIPTLADYRFRGKSLRCLLDV